MKTVTHASRHAITIGAFAALLCMAAVATAARAQTYRSMPPDPYDPHQAMPAATQPAAGGAAMAGALPPGVPVGLPQTVTESIGNSIDYPATEVRTVPIARAQQVGARAQMERAKRDLGGVIDNLWQDFEYSGEYSQASNQVKAAQDDYDQARDRVLNQLYQDPSYVALLKLRDSMADKLEQLRAEHASHSEIVATAAVKLDYATQLSDKEATALASDSGVQDARRRLTDAGRRTADMRARFDRSVRRDQAVVEGRRAVEDAKTNFLVADAFFQSSITARNIALDYATWVHRWDIYKYLHAPFYSYPCYGYGGYGGGYGSGYPSYFYSPQFTTTGTVVR